MSKAFRSACLFVFVSAGAVLSMPGCSQQGQGERCDAINGDADCNSGLSCVGGTKLAVQGVDRCCPAAGTETDSRCQRSGGLDATAGTGGSVGGASGSSGSSTGGTSAAGSSSGGMSSLPEAGGAAGASDSAPGGATNSSAGAPAMTAGAANASAGAGGAP